MVNMKYCGRITLKAFCSVHLCEESAKLFVCDERTKIYSMTAQTNKFNKQRK